MSALLVALLLVLVCPLLTCAQEAQDGRVTGKSYAVADVPNVRLADSRLYVSDPAHILSAAARDSINAILGHLEKTTGIESAVVMLPSIGETDVFDFAHSLFREWGIGKKKTNNGLLFLFVMDQRKVRITTGYGIEGTMTDAMAKRIQTQQMVPHFRNSDWDGGMVAGVRMAAQVLDGSMKPEADDSGDDDIWLPAIFALAVIVGLAIFFIVVAGESQRCPKCRKKGIRNMGTQILRDRSRRRIRRTTYICNHCGHVFYKDRRIDDNQGGGFFFIPGGGGGISGGGGGGFSGGSFGGGSTGGGGATSGW